MIIWKEKEQLSQDFISCQMINFYKFFQKPKILQEYNLILKNVLKVFKNLNSIKVKKFMVCILVKVNM